MANMSDEFTPMFESDFDTFDSSGLYGFDVEFECHILANRPMPPLDRLTPALDAFEPAVHNRLLSLVAGDRLRPMTLSRKLQPAAFSLDSRLLNCVGTTTADIQRADAATHCHILRYRGPSFRDGRQVQLMAAMAGRCAELTEGVIRDMAAYSLWSVGEWHEHLLGPMIVGEWAVPPLLTLHKEVQDAFPEVPGDDWPGPAPSISWIHTHGLYRFGLPELEILNVPEHFDDAAQALLFDLAERLIHGKRLFPGMSVGPPQRERFRIVPATVVGHLDLEEHYHGPCLRLVDDVPVHPELDDSLIHFLDDYEMFLRAQLVVPVEHDSEVLEAHRRATDQLPHFRSRFIRDRHEPASKRPEFIVKIGFPIDAANGNIPGSEWMWVTVRSWKGDTLTGLLNSKPVWRLDLKPGDPICFVQGDIFDWIIVTDGAITEGNFLQQILERRRNVPLPSDDAESACETADEL